MTDSGCLGIENVFHALALDEYRLTFGPTLFYLPTDDMKPAWFSKSTSCLTETHGGRLLTYFYRSSRSTWEERDNQT